jgi:sugar transferase (PEP-CTERM system associated)
MELNKRIILLVMADILAALLAIPSAYIVRFRSIPSLNTMLDLGAVKIAFFVLVVIFVSFIVEIYKHHRDLRTREIAARVIISLGLSFVLISSLSYSFPSVLYGRGILVLSLIIFGAFQFLCHFGYRLCVKFSGFARKVLILGVGPLAEHVGEVIPSTDDNYILSGYVNCANEQSHVPEGAILGNTDSLYETVKKQKADKIVVSLSERRGVFPLRDVMDCKLNGIEVIDAPSFYEQVTGKLLLENITPSWFIFSEGFRIKAWRRIVKRVMDVVCAAFGIVVTIPLLPFIALAIKLDSPGPVFYKQKRVGEKERNFILYKFRTMRLNAESETGAVWAQQHDPRATRVGEFFRRSRIDELPQLFNVLKGDMSLVGPRPERPEFVEELKEAIPYYSERHFVKPGVTGWAQVRYPYGASVKDALEKLRYDLYYIKNISLVFDIVIILETIKVVLFRRGGR